MALAPEMAGHLPAPVPRRLRELCVDYAPRPPLLGEWIAAVPRDGPERGGTPARFGERHQRRAAEAEVPLLAVHPGAQDPTLRPGLRDMQVETVPIVVHARGKRPRNRLRRELGHGYNPNLTP